MNKIIKNPRLLFPFFMASIMAFLMSGLMILINVGFVDHFFFVWMRSFAIAFCAAFPTAFFVAPMVQKLVKKICES
jgi:hypothetical protein